MKTIYLAAMLLSGTICAVPAQDKGKVELEAGVGILSTEDLVYDMLARFITTLFRAQQHKLGGSPTVNFSYRYYKSERFTLGAAITYKDRANRDMFPSPNGTKTQSLTLAFEGTRTWHKTGTYRMYAGFSGGIYGMKRPPDTYRMNTMTYGITGQITPIGIRVGKEAGAFAELGYGYKGVLAFGINSRF